MKNKTRSFSLSIFVLVVFGLSWPFQVAHAFLGEQSRPLLLLSMIMVAVGTYVSGKYIFKDGFKQAGWSWGKPRHYYWSFMLALIIWLAPLLLEQLLGLNTGFNQTNLILIAQEFILSFAITILPAFSEEFGWRGYLLPRLLKNHSTRKALLIHGFITWFWHLPFVVIMGMRLDGPLLLTIPGILLLTFIPTILHAVIFAYIWSVSGSLAVNTFYHAAFDEVRDSLQNTVGFGPLVEIWQMLLITLVGIGLLWKGKWKFKSLQS